MMYKQSDVWNRYKEEECQKHIHEVGLYPLDLSVFMDRQQIALDGDGIPHYIGIDAHDPALIAHYALVHWDLYCTAGSNYHREVFLKQACWLVENEQLIGDNCGGWLAVAPTTDHSGMYLSARVQGLALSVLTRAYHLTRQRAFIVVAERASNCFARDILDGGICAPVGEQGIFFQERALYPASHALCGFLFAVLGLYDYIAFVDSKPLKQILACSLTTLHLLLTEFDLGYWVRVDLLAGEMASSAHLALLAALLRALARMSGCTHCFRLAARWKSYRRNAGGYVHYFARKSLASSSRVVIRSLRAKLFPGSSESAQRVCIPVYGFPVMGGTRAVLASIAEVMEERWQLEYVAQQVEAHSKELIVHSFGTRHMAPWQFPSVWLYVLAGTWKLLSLLRQGHTYAMILPQDGVFTAVCAVLAAKVAGVRVVCIDHGNLTLVESAAFRRERIRALSLLQWSRQRVFLARLQYTFYWPSLKILAWFAVRLVDHFFIPGVAGDAIEVSCRRLGLPTSRVTRFASVIDMRQYTLPVGVNRKHLRRARSISANAIVIAIICRLAPEKGIEHALESVSRALSDCTNTTRQRICVVIAGDGPLRPYVEEEIQRRGLSANCQLWGALSHPEVLRLLQCSDIFLYTSIRGACFSMAVLEAMAAGCAVIATTEPLSNAYLLAEERGIAVPAYDLQQMSASLIALINDPDRCRAMGERAQRYIAVKHTRARFARDVARVSYWSNEHILRHTSRVKSSHEPGVQEAAHTLNRAPKRMKKTMLMPVSRLASTDSYTALTVEARPPERTPPPSMQSDLPARLPTTDIPLSPIIQTLPTGDSFQRDCPISMTSIPVIKPEKGDESYISLIRDLLKNAGIYALASLASPAIALLLSPFLTHYLSAAQYGALAVINTAIALVVGITQLGLGSAFFRAYNYDYETQRDKHATLSTVVLLLACTSTWPVVVGLLAPSWLAVLLVHSAQFSNSIIVAAIVVFLQNLSLPGFSWLRAEKRAALFTTLSIVNVLVLLASTITFVGFLNLGVAGALLAIACGYGVVTLVTLPVILLRVGLRLCIDVARELLAFGLPNAASFMSIWILQLSDRYILSYYGSLAQTASYAVAYSLGGVLSTVIIAPFSLAWPTAMYAIAKKEHAPYTFSRVFRWFNLVLLFAAYGLSLASIALLYLFFPAGYHSAAPIIPIIAASVVFYGVHIFFTVGIAVQRKTWLVVIIMSLAAITNIGLNIVLVPFYGAMGAAWATLLAYCMLAVVTFYVNQRIYPVPFDIGLFVIALIAGAALSLGSTFLAQALEPYWFWIIHGTALSLYGGVLIVLGKRSPRDKKFAYSHVEEERVV